MAARRESSTLDLALVDAEANVRPFHGVVDGEPIDIEGFTIPVADFNLLSSVGEVDQLTNEGWFRLVFSLRTDLAPRLRDLLETDTIDMEIVERGQIDISGAIIEIHAETFELPETVPRSLVEGVGRNRDIKNRKGPPCSVSKVELGGIISEEYSPGSEARFKNSQMELMVCPGTRVSLAYGITGASAVKAATIKDTLNSQDVVVPSLTPSGVGSIEVEPTKDARYVLDISDPDCAPQSVPAIIVNVITPGREIRISATFNGRSGLATWEGNPKFIGKDVMVTSIKSIDCTFGGAPPIPEWQCRWFVKNKSKKF